MGSVQVGLLLVAAVCAVSLLARRITIIPLPALLVVGGAALALSPGMPVVEIDPELVLVVFLPPLLFFPAVTASVREMRRNLRAIVLLAVGLILTTVAAVAFLVHAIVPQLSWPVAIALGAAVSPPDALSVTALGRRLRLPGRVVAILEGESLVNDATALIIYRAAVAAAVTGTFSAGRTAVEFAVSAIGAALIGLAAAWLLTLSGRRLRGEPPLQNTLFLLTPYLVYVVAETLHVSAVLAVVVAGFSLARRTSSVSSDTRLQGFAVMELVTFVLSGLAFLLIGLQIPVVVRGMEGHSLTSALGLGVLVTVLIIVVRLAWVLAAGLLPRALSPRIRGREGLPPVSAVVLVGYLGLRGVVSLAAALALPLTVNGGGPFPNRDLLLIVVVTVILVTLVGQGSTVPLLLRSLGTEDVDAPQRRLERAVARRQVADAALRRLDELQGQEWVREDTEVRVRGMFEYRRQRYDSRLAESDEAPLEQRSRDYQRLMRALIEAQRSEVSSLRDRGKIDDEEARLIERELDLEESRLE